MGARVVKRGVLRSLVRDAARALVAVGPVDPDLPAGEAVARARCATLAAVAADPSREAPALVLDGLARAFAGVAAHCRDAPVEVLRVAHRAAAAAGVAPATWP